MKMRGYGRRSKAGTAGIVATVILFSILFTVGTSYFLFVEATNAQYASNLLAASNNLQGKLGESLTVSTILIASSGDIGYYVNNTGGQNANVTTALVMSSTGQVLACVGNGLPSSSCAQQSATFSVCTNSSCSTTQSPAPTFFVVNAGQGSQKIDTGYLPVEGFVYTVKILTERGNAFTQTYPSQSLQNSNQANSAGAVSVDLNSLRWVHLIAGTDSLVQTKFVQDCNSASCGGAFGSSVAAGDALVFGLGWSGNNPPTSVTDTIGNDYTLAASNSISSIAISPSMVQKGYVANCNSSVCGASFASSVTSGDILAYGLGWYKNSPPSTPTDTLGDSFSLGASSSVVAGGIPLLVQDAYNGNCASADCGQAFSSSVTANNVLAYAVSWTGDASSPKLAGQSNQVYCNNAATCQAGKIKGVTAGDLVALSVEWYNQTAPTVTDTFSDTFTQGVSGNVTVGATTYYSAVYYAIASTSADDTMLATFGGNTNSAVMAYEVSGVSLSGLATSTGSSTTGTTTPQVTSFTPSDNSFVIASLQTVGNAGSFNQGSGYSIVGGPAPCGNAPIDACSEYDSSSSGAQTAPWTLGNSVGYTEAAIAFPGIAGTTSPPSTPTDTLANTFALGASSSLGATPALPNSKNTHWCNGSTTCQQTVNNVGTGDVVAVALGWYGASAPSVTDTFGDSFVSGVTMSKSNGGNTYYSAVYYATATSDGNDAVTATFSVSTNSVMTLYDVWGVETSGITSSTGWSASGSTSGSVSSFTPTSGSFVIASLQTMGTAGGFAQGSGYTIPGGPGPCGGGANDGCSEYDASSSGAQTAPISWGSSVGYVEAAIAFPALPNYYNSYIYYANSASSGTDAISAHFSATVDGSVSIYEINGVSVNGLQASTGSSSTGPVTASVTSFTPSSNAFVIGNVVVGGNPTYAAGTGYTLGSSNCSTNLGCSEYDNNVNSATTVQMGTNVNTWAEAAIAFQSSLITWYSYVWYATATSSGSDTISASFGATTVGSVSIYEISGATISGVLTSTGSSSSDSSTATVSSLAVNQNSLMVVNTETVGGTTFTAGTGYTLSGTCGGVYGCGEYQKGLNGTYSGTINLSPTSPFVEVAVDFASQAVYYYSYIYTSTSISTGADTVTATFSSPAAATVSMYELNGYLASGGFTSTGGSSANGTTTSVTAFTPNPSSMVISNVEGAVSGNNIAAGTGYTVISGGGSGCGSSTGCSEYQAAMSSTTTAPFTLGTSTPWVESAISFNAPINPQSGIQVGGYPTMGIPTNWNIVFQATFTNQDPEQRSVTLWPESVLTLTSIISTGQPEQSVFYIIDSLNADADNIVAYGSTNGNFLTLPYGVPTTIYFGASEPQGSGTVAVDAGPGTSSGPFYTFFSLSGAFSDNKLYGVTIPFPYGMLAGANAYTSVTAGNTGSQVTVSCTNPCKFADSTSGFVAWIDSAGQMTNVANFTTTSTGNLPSGLTFNVPSAAAGYYTIMVTDYADTVFMTFQHT